MGDREQPGDIPSQSSEIVCRERLELASGVRQPIAGSIQEQSYAADVLRDRLICHGKRRQERLHLVPATTLVEAYQHLDPEDQHRVGILRLLPELQGLLCERLGLGEMSLQLRQHDGRQRGSPCDVWLPKLGGEAGRRYELVSRPRDLAQLDEVPDTEGTSLGREGPI